MTAPEHEAGPPPARVGRQERAEQLLDVTLALIATEGYEAVTVQAIAEAAGITKPIIYRIYPGLNALYIALLRREQRRTEAVLDTIIPKDPGDRRPVDVLTESLTGILRAVAEHPLTWQLALFPPEGTPAPLRAAVERRRERLVKRARKLVTWGVADLDVDSPPDADILARMLVSWAEEHARILLEDNGITAEHLVASATALVHSVRWRETPADHPSASAR